MITDAMVEAAARTLEDAPITLTEIRLALEAGIAVRHKHTDHSIRRDALFLIYSYE